MPSVTLTAQWVERVRPPDAGQVDYFDTRLPGFGLRVSSSGRRAWCLLYRAKGSPRKRRLTLGVYPALSLADARELARVHLVAVDRGEDPAEANKPAPEALTFAGLAELYLERHVRGRLRSAVEVERKIRREMLPTLGAMPAHEVKRRDVIKLLDAIVDRGSPMQANKVRSLLAGIYHWGMGRDLVEHDPCRAIPMPAREVPSDRFLSDDEIRAFWAASAELAPQHRAAMRFRLLTAQRGGETYNMEWQHLDLAGRWWTIPAELAKNGTAHRVPLSSSALAILEELGPRSTGGVFLPQTGGLFPANATKWQMACLRKATGITFKAHDLRRTAASHIASIGIPRLVISKILNHAEAGVTRIYDRHSYDAEKRAALDAWAERLAAIVAGP